MYPPEIISGYEPWLEAFWMLSTERQIGMSVGPVPASHVFSAAQRLNIAGDEFELFSEVMSRLDVAYLNDMNKELEKTRENPTAPKQNVSTRPMSTALFDALF